MSRGVAHAVELALDEDAADVVRGLFGSLEEAGITSLRSGSPHLHPHVSVTVATDADPAQLAEVLSGVASIGLPAITMSSVGIFVAPQVVIYLGVTPTAELATLNERVHERLGASGLDTWALYAPGTWVPHCTLAMRPASLGAAIEALQGAPLPIRAAPVALRVVEVPTGKLRVTIE
jgi:2'-5' RNA ligase